MPFGPRGEFADQPALTQARLPDHTDQLASIRGEGLVQRVQIRFAAQQDTFAAAQDHTAGFDREELPRGHGLVESLDGDVFDGAQPRGTLDQPRCLQ